MPDHGGAMTLPGDKSDKFGKFNLQRRLLRFLRGRFIAWSYSAIFLQNNFVLWLTWLEGHFDFEGAFVQSRRVWPFIRHPMQQLFLTSASL